MMGDKQSRDTQGAEGWDSLSSELGGLLSWEMFESVHTHYKLC